MFFEVDSKGEKGWVGWGVVDVFFFLGEGCVWYFSIGSGFIGGFSWLIYGCYRGRWICKV